MNKLNKTKLQKILLAIALVAIGLMSVGAVASGLGAPAKTNTAAFQDAMRKLWEDHITWTRLVIVSVLNGLPDTPTTVARLLQNQADIRSEEHTSELQSRGHLV